MERRSFLKYSGALASGALASGAFAGATALGAVVNPSLAIASGGGLTGKKQPPPQTLSNGLSPYTGAWTPIQVRHLLRRAMPGVPYAQWNAASTMSLTSLIAMLLDTSSAIPAKPAPWVDEYLAPDATITDPKLLDIDTKNKAALEAARSLQIKNWWMDRMLSANLNLNEKMSFMWSNHFVIGTNVVNHAGYVYQYTQTLRQYALGNIKNFVTAIATDPAMLLYLNGNQSYFGVDPSGVTVGNHVNENFARELMELFTLGRLDPKTSAPNYTEDDIRNSGQALSGWQPTKTAPFVGQLLPQCHNTGLKTFMGKTGNLSLSDIIDSIFALGGGYNVAYLISQRIYTTFVHWIPNPAVVDAMATLLVKSKWELQPVISALLSSAHFYDPSLIGAHIKSPVEFIGSLIREFEVTYPAFDPSDPTVKSTDANGYITYSDPNPTLTYLTETLATSIGQDILNPPNVKGWVTGSDWITTRTYQDRQQIGLAMFQYPDPFNGSPNANGVTLGFKADEWMKSFPGQANMKIKALSSAIEAHHLGVALGPVETQALYLVVNALNLPEGEWNFSLDYGAAYARALSNYPEFQLL